MARPSKPRPKYRSPCECGECPRLPTNRPATLGEWLEYWGHDGWYSAAKVERLAVELYVFRYAQWVNQKGWRKPPGYTGGRVPRHRVRPKGKPITAAQVHTATQRLLAERRRQRERTDLERAG